jgi:hypothetical protein
MTDSSKAHGDLRLHKGLRGSSLLPGLRAVENDDMMIQISSFMHCLLGKLLAAGNILPEVLILI